MIARGFHLFQFIIPCSIFMINKLKIEKILNNKQGILNIEVSIQVATFHTFF
jgi:hypothetical protein